MKDRHDRDVKEQEGKVKMNAGSKADTRQVCGANYVGAIADVMSTFKWAILNPEVKDYNPVDALVDGEFNTQELGDGKLGIYKGDELITVIRVLDDIVIDRERIMLVAIDTLGPKLGAEETSNEHAESTMAALLDLIKGALLNAACIMADGKPKNRILLLDWDTSFRGVVGIGGEKAKLKEDIKRVLDNRANGKTGNLAEILPQLEQIVDDNKELFAKELKRIGFEGSDDEVVKIFIEKYRAGRVGLVIFTNGYLESFDDEFVRALKNSGHISEVFEPTEEDKPLRYGKIIHKLVGKGIIPLTFLVPDEDLEFFRNKSIKKLSKRIYRVVSFNKRIKELVYKLKRMRKDEDANTGQRISKETLAILKRIRDNMYQDPTALAEEGAYIDLLNAIVKDKEFAEVLCRVVALTPSITDYEIEDTDYDEKIAIDTGDFKITNKELKCIYYKTLIRSPQAEVGNLLLSLPEILTNKAKRHQSEFMVMLSASATGKSTVMDAFSRGVLSMMILLTNAIHESGLKSAQARDTVGVFYTLFRPLIESAIGEEAADNFFKEENFSRFIDTLLNAAAAYLVEINKYNLNP